MTDRELHQMSLEALKQVPFGRLQEEAIASLRERLAHCDRCGKKTDGIHTCSPQVAQPQQAWITAGSHTAPLRTHWEGCEEVHPECSPKQEPVAWCQLTAAGGIAYFDGKPMVMAGKVGNEMHPAPLYTAPQRRERLAQQPNLNCKSVQARLAAQWGYVKAEPQEPVAWGYTDRHGQITDCITPEEYTREAGGYTVPLYTAPQRREWVGLTEGDLSVCDADGVLLARYWEAKLKEKNG